MVKKIVKTTIIGALILVSILSWNIMTVFAISQSDLEEAEKKIEETKKDIDQVERKLSNALSQIQSLNAEIAEYENAISDLNYKIEAVDKQISETEEELKKAEEDYADQEEKLKKRLVALYEAGNTTYLDVLLSAKSMTDFISKCHVVSEIAENDRNLLTQMEENKNKIADTKELLQTSKEQVVALKSAKEDTAKTLKNSQSQKREYASQLSEEEKALEAELEQFEKDKKAIQEELERIARENNGGKDVIPGDPSSAGYIFPVAGLNIYNINRRYYPSYPGHTGVDININVRGKSVIAAKAGTVVISAAQRYANGEYRSYGEYVVIDHHDGTMTLYAHMSPDSRRVSKGEEVVQGQVLGIVGTTGNSTGLHLHFEVRVNGRCVNPLPYLQ